MARRSPSGPPSPGAHERSLENSGQPSVSWSSPPNSSTAWWANSMNDSRSCSSSDVPDVAHQPRLEQVEQPGEQLAAGQVSGRSEQDDGGGLHRHGPSLPLMSA